MADRSRYQLQNEAANRLIAELVEIAGIPPERRGYFQHMLTTVLKLHEDGTPTGDLKVTNTALKELRYAYKVFAPYRMVRKVTVFGSARTAGTDDAAVAAREFGTRMVQEKWMVVTGAGAGIMGAAQEGAGGEKSFGLNIRLPFEQEANPWIASDPKLVTFKYFFTRKLFLVREAHAMAYFPGGFGTADEVFETLTLIQTGKASIVPVLLVDSPGGKYWEGFEEFVRGYMARDGMISPEDLALYRRIEDVAAAVAECERFYRVFHSQRYVGERLVFRLRRPLEAITVEKLSADFSDILSGPIEQTAGPLDGEGGELPGLPRLRLPFNRRNFGRLRLLIDAVNEG